MPTFELNIFSPRRGHDDSYSFDFERDTLSVSMGPRRALCTWREDRDPLWAGEPLARMLANESICPPEDFEDFVCHVWQAWRRGDIQGEDAGTELRALVDWLNAITRAKPRTDFWRRYF